MKTTKPIYSIRDAFDGELWWTTNRKSAIEVVAAINALQSHTTWPQRAFWRTNGQAVSKEIRKGQLPAAVFRLVPVKVKP